MTGSESMSQNSSHRDLMVIGLPADLNWAENLWGIMGYMLNDYQSPVEDLTELKKRLLKAWKDIPLSTLSACAASMRERLRYVIKTKGEALRS
jgi:hypothetical protein